MIEIFKSEANELKRLSSPVTGSWINLTNPTPEEIAQISALGIPSDYLTYPLDLDERARTERENGELLIVLRIPYYQGAASDIPYTSIPLGIIVNDQWVITVCKLENEIVREVIDRRMKDLVTAKRLRFVLRLLMITASRYLLHLREITKRVDILEDELQQSTRNKEVLELLKYQKSLTFFTTALKSNELMIERLRRSRLFETYPEDEDLLEDVLTENQQAIEMTNITSNILSSMMDAFASIISNNLNAVMKFLASITILLSFPTMIASFFGMNVHVPLEDNLFAFIFIIAFAFMIVGVVVYVFWKRDWF
jgi:magnesium transporter